MSPSRAPANSESAIVDAASTTTLLIVKPWPAAQARHLHFAGCRSDQWRTSIDITARNDSLRQIAVQYRRDGRMVRGEGDNDDGDSAPFKSPAANILVMSQAKDKALAGVRVYSISPDGNEMTESAADVDSTGAPFVQAFYFKRIAE